MLAAVCVSFQVSLCRGDGQLQKRIGEIADASAADDNFSGPVLLARNGQIVCQKSFGFADREKSNAFTDRTASNIASVGKMLTSVLILKLAEKKKPDLADPIRKFLPDTKIPNADKITIHHLLTHTSGPGSCRRHADYAKLLKNSVTIDEIVGLIEQPPLVFDEPGTRFE